MKLRSLLPVLALFAFACGSREKPWNLLVVTLDTTRADALGCYGNAGIRTPHLDRLAREGIVFENAMTAVPITTPSHSTIFTGTYPLAHGVRDNGRFKLAPSSSTLAERLHERGFATGAAIGAFPLTKNWGLDQGFDFYDDHITVATEDEGGRRRVPFKMFFDERPASRVNDAILPWLREHGQKQFFAWVHYWDAHQPHVPPPPFSDLYPHNLYYGEIAYVDQAVGVLFEELRRQGVDGRTIVLVVGDHGEGLGEHEEDTHSMLLYEATLHVPMILKFPGGPAGLRIAERVGTVDIVPTLLDLLGLPADGEAQGRSLVTAVTNPEAVPGDRRAYYSETLSPRLSYGWGEQRALFLEQWKLLFGPRIELYDLRKDPSEIHNLAPSAEASRLEAALQTFVDRHARASAASAVSEVDAETRSRLAALGYLSLAGEAPSVEERLRRDGDAPQDHISQVSIWSRCKSSLEKGDFLAARELAVLLIQRDPHNPFYLALMVSAELGLGRVREAATIAESGPISQPNADNYQRVATELFAGGDRERGIALARRVAKEAPSAAILYLVAEMSGAQGDAAGHEKELRAALALDAAFGPARRSLAILLATAGRDEAAEAEFREMVTRQPLDPISHLNYATFLMAKQRYPDAERELDRSIELDPVYWKAQIARVVLLKATGRGEAAHELAQRIAVESPDAQLAEQARRLVEGVQP
ncbi:MAG: sulfatase-like hydrolase/transferase [Thermoanaerobaculia bacterium]